MSDDDDEKHGSVNHNLVLKNHHHNEEGILASASNDNGDQHMRAALEVVTDETSRSSTIDDDCSAVDVNNIAAGVEEGLSLVPEEEDTARVMRQPHSIWWIVVVFNPILVLLVLLDLCTPGMEGGQIKIASGVMCIVVSLGAVVGACLQIKRLTAVASVYFVINLAVSLWIIKDENWSVTSLVFLWLHACYYMELRRPPPA